MSAPKVESAPIGDVVSLDEVHNRRGARRVAAAIFLIGALAAGSTVAGPGLTWDEPAYRYSQVTLQNWFRLLREAPDAQSRQDLYSPEAIRRFWQYNRFGHNFHPPMGGYLNLASWGIMHPFWDDISSRRLASALAFAFTAALLAYFVGVHYGCKTGAFAALCLLTMPRLMGHAHVIGTDMPLLLFWSTTAVFFYWGLSSRFWQWAAAVSWGCLFLVKFTGAVIGAPILIYILISMARQASWREWKRWLAWTAVVALPLIPLAITLLYGERVGSQPPSLRLSIARLGMENAGLLTLAFFWPLMCLVAYYLVSKPRPASAEAVAAKRGRWAKGWEFLWVAAAVTPLTAIALNPTWHHDPVGSLASYFDLNLNRQGHLPDIGIFYLGDRYLYSLPPSNAYVLMAVTIPIGTLLLGSLGIVRTLVRFSDPLPWYLLLQMLTLPAFRMLPTPAHDGVRLFLPTFFFWAAFAGLGAKLIVAWVRPLHPRLALATAGALLLVGPIWAGWQWLRIHPYELSYYNVGLKRGMDWGFEVTYWYDAVTPRVLDELNEKLPEGVAVGFPDPNINPETFYQLQELGRLRPDIRFDVGLAGMDVEQTKAPGMPWYWLLTHSSKSTAYTKLLYACQPWYESGHAGVRLFSVVDGRSSGLAFALHLIAVDYDPTPKTDPILLNEFVFDASEDELQRAVLLLLEHRGAALEHLGGEPAVVQQLLRLWILPDGKLRPNVEMLLRHDPEAFRSAASVLARRGADVRRIIATAGYLRPEQFGGYFQRDDR